MSYVSLVNLRDVGGLALTTGGTTRPGVLLRSDAPYDGDADLATGPLVVWPPTRVVDLRDEGEAAAGLYSWPTGVARISNPLFTQARVDRALEDLSLSDLYANLLREAPARITSALNNFDAEGTTLVHCAAGKDRTGVTVAVALLLSEADPEAIADDYARTADAIAMVRERMIANGRITTDIAVGHQLLGSPREAIGVVVDTVSTAPGGVWGWFADNGGDVAHLEAFVARLRG
ncbi:tyrosine-protein phosphatase [Gordonia sp. ABSL1-1]|uniref:tyrosine-protein phosphatase n=1 Tax=Gordonia sp. ABSL1-1 TaxID=3053923 RepID=UPI0025737E89|nr:tyrosine-protein phosphatase [Gordonia sp. ABSL1-1]MDL9937453.1 tyrosine-protein phosphatase [Gordonia sp. ABSL1-1]